jgi:hypothetical protein
MVLHPGPDHPKFSDGLTRVALVHVVAVEEMTQPAGGA